MFVPGWPTSPMPDKIAVGQTSGWWPTMGYAAGEVLSGR